jgi:hypothetical protein
MAIYVLIPNVVGDVTVPGYEKCFVADSFSFGVEREMKESGEKGGTEDIKPGRPMAWDIVRKTPWDAHGIVLKGA